MKIFSPDAPPGGMGGPFYFILQWLRDKNIVPASGGTWGAIAESLVDEHQCTEGEDVLFMSADEWKQAGFKGVSVFKLQKMKDEKDR